MLLWEISGASATACQKLLHISVGEGLQHTAQLGLSDQGSGVRESISDSRESMMRAFGCFIGVTSILALFRAT